MDVREGRGSRVLRVAIATGAVQLSERISPEILDGDGAAAVVLQDLVRG